MKDLNYFPYRNLITNFFKINPSYDINFLHIFNDKNLLIIDDVMSSGVTLYDMFNLTKNWEPKSVKGYVLIK